MWKVNGCLCFTLETGGKIIGWLGVIGTGLLISILILIMAGLLTLSCTKIDDMSENFGEKAGLDLETFECKTLFGTIIIAVLILIAICMAVFTIYILLLRGISNQNHKQIFPVLVLEGIFLVSIVLFELSKLTIGGFIQLLITGFIRFYFFAALYSLYVKVRDGNQRSAGNVHFTKPPNQA